MEDNGNMENGNMESEKKEIVQTYSKLIKFYNEDCNRARKVFNEVSILRELINAPYYSTLLLDILEKGIKEIEKEKGIEINISYPSE